MEIAKLDSPGSTRRPETRGPSPHARDALLTPHGTECSPKRDPPYVSRRKLSRARSPAIYLRTTRHGSTLTRLCLVLTRISASPTCEAAPRRDPPGQPRPLDPNIRRG